MSEKTKVMVFETRASGDIIIKRGTRDKEQGKYLAANRPNELRTHRTRFRG